MDYSFAKLQERTFLEVLGSGVYHSTELFCDYVPDKLYPPIMFLVNCIHHKAGNHT